eukprot:COSAG05_NODE_3873_length_1795_cov_52.030095_1_plen_215_part_00
MEVAQAFFDACESGKGAAECAQFLAYDATFSCQAMDSLPGPKITECRTVSQYTDWMKGVVDNMGDKATYTIDAAAFDEARSTAVFVATFGGFSHYSYTIKIEADKVVAMTKVWNDAYAFSIMSAAPPEQPAAEPTPTTEEGVPPQPTTDMGVLTNTMLHLFECKMIKAEDLEDAMSVSTPEEVYPYLGQHVPPVWPAAGQYTHSCLASPKTSPS